MSNELLEIGHSCKHMQLSPLCLIIIMISGVSQARRQLIWLLQYHPQHSFNSIKATLLGFFFPPVCGGGALRIFLFDRKELPTWREEAEFASLTQSHPEPSRLGDEMS